MPVQPALPDTTFTTELDRLRKTGIQPGLETAATLARKSGLDAAYKYQIQVLRGSNPTFENRTIKLKSRAKSNALVLWFEGSHHACPLIPFFRFGRPQDPQETSVYLYNRVEPRGMRWVCYQEAREQEIFVPDDELSSLLASDAS